jgi:hypothetical protein
VVELVSAELVQGSVAVRSCAAVHLGLVVAGRRSDVAGGSDPGIVAVVESPSNDR